MVVSKNIWCLEAIKIVSTNLVGVINRLLTSVMLVVLLISCQDMPKNSGHLGIIQLERPVK